EVRGPRAVEVDVGDAAGEGDALAVELDDFLGREEAADGEAGEHADGAREGYAGVLVEARLGGGRAEEAGEIAEVVGAAEGGGEAEEEAERVGEVLPGVGAEVD